MSEDERKAVAFYAVLSRDIPDFIEMLGEASDETLKTLYLILVLPNAEHDERTVDLNKFGADIVRGQLTKRSLPVPELPKKEKPADELPKPKIGDTVYIGDSHGLVYAIGTDKKSVFVYSLHDGQIEKFQWYIDELTEVAPRVGG